MITAFAAVHSALVSPAKVAAANDVLSRAYRSSSYDDRLMLGRRLQLGDAMVYRPSLIGGSGGTDPGVDGSRTYGEYDLGFFATLVDRALDGVAAPPDGAHFVDVGSGVGRLVLAASLLWPSQLRRCSGVEVVAELHQLAVEATAQVQAELPVPCDFVRAEAAEVLAPAGRPLATADVCFAYSSAFASEGDTLSDFSRVCGTCLRPGTRVVTTDKRLLSVDGLWSFELLDCLEGTMRRRAVAPSAGSMR